MSIADELKQARAERAAWRAKAARARAGQSRLRQKEREAEQQEHWADLTVRRLVAERDAAKKEA